MTYKDAARAVAADYENRKQAYALAERNAFETNADFLACEKEMRALQLDAAFGKKVDAKKLKDLERTNAQMRKRLHLVPPAPLCPVCGDTGRANGRFCECVLRRAAQTHSDAAVPLHDFATVDYSTYGTHADFYKKLLGDLQTICTLFPNNKKRCIVLSGNTGNGKTYAAGCVANEILRRGLSALTLTAFAANNLFLKYHTCFDAEKASILDPLLDCTLLVIDDLGTESILKNVTLEYLYLVLNERNAAGKLTMFTTNLSQYGIRDRYGDRIYSRLFDKSLTYALSLTTPDLRKVL